MSFNGFPADTIIHGDAAAKLAHLPDASVHLVVTSPPYFDLKDYDSDDQLGYGDTLDEYLASLERVWGECWRVLHPGGRFCVNIGDQYHPADPEANRPYCMTPLHMHVALSVLDAYDDALYFQPIHWRKITNQETSGGASVMGTYPRPRGGHITYTTEYIFPFKKPGTPPTPTCTPAEQASAELSLAQWRDLFSDHWQFTGARSERHDHPAPFPERLPRRLIRMFTFPDDVVLDPFVGSGTTCAVARQLSRRYLGIDTNREYVERARERCQQRPIKAFVIDGGNHQ